MNKYPITYKGKTYEVRWEDRLCGNSIAIYEVKHCFKFKFYKYIYVELERDINKHMTVRDSDPNYYIEQVKTLFKMWEIDKAAKEYSNTIKDNKINALKRWNGIIE